MNYAQTKAQNFVGAKSELAAALQELDQARVKEFLRAKDCDWINFNMNVPAASHMGGIWARMIRSVRSVLSVLLQEQGAQLDDEALRTLMTEAENVINSRPLTVENLADPASPEPITLNFLLYGVKSANYDINCALFREVQTFIINTNLFSMATV